MSADTTVLLVGSAPEREGQVRAALRDLATVRSDRSLAAARTAGGGYRIALVDLVDDEDAGLAAIEELARVQPQLPIIALASVKDPELILQAMRAGAREFVVPAEAAVLSRVVSELVRKLSADVQSGTIVSMFASKGGLGATTMAANLAGALAAEGKRVVLVDLDLQLGDVLVFLDASSRYTIAEVLQNIKRLDRDLLQTSLQRHSSGVYLLAQSDRLEDADKVTPAQIATLLQFLARNFDYVVCDGLRGFDELALATLDASDKVVLLVTQDVPSIKNGQRCLDVMRRLGYGDDKLHLVVNRHQKSDIDLQSIADNLGVPVMAAVANDYQTVVKAINRGRMLADVAPRSRIVDDIARAARMFSGAPAPRGDKRGGGFLRGLFARSSDEKTTKRDQAEEEDAGDEPERAPEAV